MSRPRGQHMQLLPGMPRHRPECTKRRRAEEGCECSIWYYLREEGPLLPSAREWRARRRATVRSWHAWDMQVKRHGLPPQHNHLPLHCDPGCPAFGFVYSLDWPPTITSWKALLR